MAARASSTEMWCTKCTAAEMEWLRTTGTRTQVHETFMSGRCRILRPSFWSFISSEV